MKNLIAFFYAIGLMLGAFCYNVSESLADKSGRKWAVVQNPIIGRSRGKLANVVFTTQFGKNVLKSKALQVANPNTAPQQLQRGKLSSCMPFAKVVLSIIHVGLRKVAIGMSPFNYALKNLLLDVISGTVGAFTFDWSKFVVASGELYGVPDASATASAGLDVAIAWTDNTGVSNALGTDKAYAVAFKNDGELASFALGTRTRSQESATIACDQMTAGNKVEVYIFLTSANGSIISDSQYLGEKTLIS